MGSGAMEVWHTIWVHAVLACSRHGIGAGASWLLVVMVCFVTDATSHTTHHIREDAGGERHLFLELLGVPLKQAQRKLTLRIFSWTAKTMCGRFEMRGCPQSDGIPEKSPRDRCYGYFIAGLTEAP
mmetsp:Transcript_98627/g.180057  ORF Transcript_98627/g.180057 Transcript_98627/m.180057 type:complete len:126 (+) Transcript_98627:1314-1691(+)